MDNHVKKGIFLGYKSSSSHVYYLDMDTEMLKTSKHVRFDEGMDYLEIPTPNAR